VILFRGTDLAAAKGFLAGAKLDAVKAAAGKIDGPPRFFLATHIDTAENFAYRRALGVVLDYKLSAEAHRG
jgi:hypothetical protein